MRGGEQQLASTSVTGAKIMAAAAAAAEGAAVNLTILLSFPHRDAAAGLRMGRGCTQGLWLTWLGTVTEDSWLQCQ